MGCEGNLAPEIDRDKTGPRPSRIARYEERKKEKEKEKKKCQSEENFSRQWMPE